MSTARRALSGFSPVLFSGLLLGLGPAARAEPEASVVYASASVELVRWPDSTVVVKAVKEGARLEVLAQEDGRTRVRTADNIFGWLATDQTAAEPPAVEAAAEGEGIDLGSGPPTLPPPFRMNNP